MGKEELKNINTDYMLEKLAVAIKELDLSLTKYLIKDMYKNQKQTKDDLFDDISYVKTLLVYIIEEYKKETVDYQETYELSDFAEFFGDCAKIRNAWLSLIELKAKICDFNNSKKIKVNFNKGFDFGFGYRNFSSLDICYVKYEDAEHAWVSHRILNITSTNGLNFNIYKEDFYDNIFGLKMDNDDRKFSYTTQSETIDKVKELLLIEKREE